MREIFKKCLRIQRKITTTPSNNKQLMNEVEHDIENYQGRGG